MTNTKHALLSPSSSERWLICTPCAVLESTQPIEEPSSFAKEGTLAHTYGEICFKELIKSYKKGANYGFLKEQIESTKEYNKLIQDKQWNNDIGKIVWNSYVLPIWRNTVGGLRDNYSTEEEKNSYTLIEEKLEWNDDSFKNYGIKLPPTWGYGDFIHIRENELDIYDLKFGKNVEVKAENNTQLYIYASMAFDKIEKITPINRIRITAIQPRMSHLSSTVTLTKDQMIEWIKNIETKANQASAGEGLFITGTHCRWCKATNVCPEMNNKVKQIATTQLETKPNALTISDDLALETFKMIPTIKAYIERLEKYMIKRVQEGHTFEGYELRSSKKYKSWKNDESIITKLKKAGWKEEEFMTKPELKSVSQIKKLIGNRAFMFIGQDEVEIKPCTPSLMPIKKKEELDPYFGNDI